MSHIAKVGHKVYVRYVRMYWAILYLIPNINIYTT
jgi:hypothetical protein